MGLTLTQFDMKRTEQSYKMKIEIYLYVSNQLKFLFEKLASDDVFIKDFIISTPIGCTNMLQTAYNVAILPRKITSICIGIEVDS